MESLWQKDLRVSEEVGKFLDMYLYPRLEGFGIHKAERVTDLGRQYAGVDVIAQNRNREEYRIDEKAQTDYINLDLPTNAFEIEFLDKVNHRPKVGWLCDDTLETTHYLLVWLHAVNGDPRTLRWEQITGAYCILISKEVIARELDNRGLSVAEMQAAARRYRRADDGENRKDRICPGIFYYFTCSGKKAESPFQVLITKRLLSQWAELCVTVTPDGISLGGAV